MSNLRDVRPNPPPDTDIGDPIGVVDNLHTVFPKTLDQFQTDPRVSWSKLDNKWVLEDDKGDEWEFDETHERWIPSVRAHTSTSNIIHGMEL